MPRLYLLGLLGFASVAFGQWSTAPRLVTKAPSAASSTATSRLPQTTVIEVGKGDFIFKPDTIQAAVGDTVEFRFYPTNHSVVRADYLSPCIPYELLGRGKTGFFSGFRPVDAILDDPPKFSVLVNDTDPIFFYCSAPNSCIGHGMVGVINPNATTSLAKHKEQAKKSLYMLQPGERFPDEELPSTTSTASPSSTSKSSSTMDAHDHDHTASPAVAGEHHTLSTGAIVGISLGGIFVIAIMAALFFFIGRSRALKQRLDGENPAYTPRPGSILPTGDMYQSGGVVYMPVANGHHSSGLGMVGYKPAAGTEEMGYQRSVSPLPDQGSPGPIYNHNGRFSPLPSTSPPPRAPPPQPQGPHELYAPIGRPSKHL